MRREQTDPEDVRNQVNGLFGMQKLLSRGIMLTC